MGLREHEDSPFNTPKSYYLQKKEARREARLTQSKELKQLFLKAQEYYQENYPNSQEDPKITWDKKKKKELLFDEDKVFFDELKGRSRDDLLTMREILLYSIKEHNYKKVSTYYRMKELRGRIKNLIPGGKILEEIEKLEAEKSERENTLKRLKEEYAKEVGEAKQAVDTKDLKDEERYICPKCGKEMGNAGGLGSHIKYCKA